MDTNMLIRKSLEALPNFLIINEKGTIVFINQVYCNLLGKPVDAILGQPVKKIIPHTRMLHVLKTGKPETGDIITFYHHERKENVELVCNRIPLIESGKIVGAAAVTTFEKMSDLEHLYAELDRFKQENIKYKEQIELLSNPLGRIIGTSPAIMEIKNTISDFAKSNLAILLTGESGVGKEVFANAIHEMSIRRLNSFVKINCAAIPGELLESELFGYEEGSFTGAKKSGKIGKFELADEGTLLLDEIGEMPIPLQAKLLRVLQEKEIERIGGTKPKKINVRIICSTNKNVARLVEEGKFREDLYYRINTIELEIPPLRERKSDIPALCDFFIRKSNEEYGHHTQGIDEDVLALFETYPWPGNIRELQHVLERLAFLNPQGRITMKHCDFLKKKIKSAITAPVPSGIEAPSGTEVPSGMENDIHYKRSATEIAAIKDALKETGGNKSKAARLLGISRSMLYNKLNQYGIS